MAALRVAVLAAVVAVLSLPAAAHAGQPLPPQGPSPPGTNDFGCKPPPRHPYPVVLVHGTFEDMTASWNAVAPALTRLGYCVFALDYGTNATGDIPTSAGQLATFVDEVLARTHASKVSIVGHSQGGMMPRYLIKFLGYGGKVDDLVGLSPSNHGTTNPLAGPLGQAACPACGQQVAGSEFMQHLNAGDQTPAPVDYTVIETSHDEVVTPYQSEFLPPTADGRVTNVLLQDRCPNDGVEHVGVQYDGVALQWMLSALGRPGPADPAYVPDCSGARAMSFPDSSSVPAGGGARARRVWLVLGGVRRHGHTLHAAVEARGATLRGVVVTITHGKRVVARKRLARLPGRRVVVLRPKQRPRRHARYALAARAGAIHARRTFRLR